MYFTDNVGYDETRTSAATETVAAARPTEPLGLTVSRGGNQDLDASWQAPASDGGSAITGYTMQWKEAADSWDTPDDVSETTLTGTAYTITGLDTSGKYDVRVRAANAIGDGPWSDTVTAALLTVPGAPTIKSLTVHSLPPEDFLPDIKIVWSAPADNGGLAITSYDLRAIPSDLLPLREGSDSEWEVLEDIVVREDSGDLKTHVTGLVAGVEYEFQVRAVNAEGRGAWSAGKRETYASAPYQAEVLTFSDDGVLRVDVNPAPHNGGLRINSYDVRYIRTDAADKADDNWTLVRNLEPTHHLIWSWFDHTIEDLINGVRYDVQARAVNAVGPAKWSKTFSQMPAGKPSPPVLERLIVGDRRLTVEWHRPEDDGGPRARGLHLVLHSQRRGPRPGR